MVTERAVPEVGHMRFGLVKPVVDCEIVVDLAAPLFDTRQCVVVGVCHLSSRCYFDSGYRAVDNACCVVVSFVIWVQPFV